MFQYVPCVCPYLLPTRAADLGLKPGDSEGKPTISDASNGAFWRHCGASFHCWTGAGGFAGEVIWGRCVNARAWQ